MFKVRGASPVPVLTSRQAQVIGLIAEGWKNREIAAAMFISASTVQTQLEQARERLGARNRSHAVAIAIRNGLID